MADENKPAVELWDRLDTEGDDEWGAFRNYRDMLPPRRIKDASIKSTATLSAWYNRFNWHDRVTAFDRHLDGIRRAEREALIKVDEQVRTARHLGLLSGIEDVLDRELAKLNDDSRGTTAWGLLKVGELNQLVETVIKYKRLIHGETTENVGVKRDLSKLSLDELRQLRDLERKIALEDAPGKVALKVVK